jgi:hypothetical protein
VRRLDGALVGCDLESGVEPPHSKIKVSLTPTSASDIYQISYALARR